MAAALGAFMLVFQVVGVGGVRRLAPATAPAAGVQQHTPARQALGESISVLRANPSFRILVTSYLLMSTTTHLVLAGLPYFAEYELDRPAFTTVLMALFMAPALLTTPLWFRVSRRRGKQRCLLAAQAIFVIGSLVLLVGSRVHLAVVLLATFALGIAFAGLQLFPFSMVPDTVRAGGEAELARAGAYTGVWTATEAVGAAAGPYLYSAALALGGFVGSTADEDVVQTDGARLAVLLGFTVISAAVMGLSLLSQRRYRLDGAAQSARVPVA